VKKNVSELFSIAMRFIELVLCDFNLESGQRLDDFGMEEDWETVSSSKAGAAAPLRGSGRDHHGDK
jgi:hypothetical protein